MKPIEFNIPFVTEKRIELQPGEVVVTSEPMRITTILGSCVAVCIFDRKLKISGMNHFLLAQPPSKEDEQNFPHKYAKTAILELLRRFKKAGSHPRDLDVKIAGGANIGGGPDSSIPAAVGKDNIETTRRILAGFNLNITAEDVGGFRGRRIELNTTTGELRLQRFKESEAEKNKKKIRVLIIDDSKTMRMILKKVIESSPDCEVCGEAEDVSQAILIRKKIKPDVITLDLNLPGLDGASYLKQYMPTDPVPTLIVTSYSSTDSPQVLEALAAGAFDHVGKQNCESQAYAENLLSLVRAANESRGKSKLNANTSKLLTVMLPNEKLSKNLVVMGASTGGTEALRVVLQSFPANMPPILIVQHIPPIFSKSFAESLNQTCKMRVKEAESGDLVEPGRIYIAQGGRHMKLVSTGMTMRLELTDEPEVNRFRPSVDYLFHSVRSVLDKRKDLKTTAVLLTGMGCDGADGLLKLRQAGVETIAQNEATSVVFGMPREAIERGAAKHILGITEVAERVVTIINTSHRKPA
jgi:two-component system chemotaxis response regulator CheB